MALGPIAAGRLRHRVTIRRPTDVPDGHGGFTNGWADVGTFAAMVEGLNGREALLAAAMEGISTFRITTRWNAALVASDVPAWQIETDGGQLLNVRSAADPDGRRLRIEFLADTGSVQAEN